MNPLKSGTLTIEQFIVTFEIQTPLSLSHTPLMASLSHSLLPNSAPSHKSQSPSLSSFPFIIQLSIPTIPSHSHLPISQFSTPPLNNGCWFHLFCYLFAQRWARHHHPHHQKPRLPRNVEALFSALPSHHCPRWRPFQDHQGPWGFWLWAL